MIGPEPPGGRGDPDRAARPPGPQGVAFLDVAPGWDRLRQVGPGDGPGGGPQGPWLSLDEWLGRAVLTEDRAGVRGAVAAALAGGAELVATFRAAAAEPPWTWMQLRGTPEGAGNGAGDKAGAGAGAGDAGPRRWAGVLADVTPAVRAAEARARHGEAQALFRARNTLSAVRAVLRLDVAPGTSAADLASMMDGRVGALARTLVGFGQDAGRDAPGRRPVEDVLRDELVAAAVRDEAVRIEGPPTGLPFRPAQVMGLAFHDLILASLQDGALADPLGRVAVAWRVEGDMGGPVLALDWDERAPSLAPSPAGWPGLDLLGRMLAYEGGGLADVERGDGRLACRIRLPLVPGADPTGPP